MATTVNVTSSFKGLPAGEIFGTIFLKANTIETGSVTVMPNVVGSGFLRMTGLQDGLADYSCGFNPAGVVDLTEKEYTPKKLKVNLEICKEDFRQRWSAAQMGFSAWNGAIPADEKEALMLELQGSISKKIDSLIWNGDKDTSGEFNGILTELADAITANVAGKVPNVVTGAAITASNVIAKLGAVVDATPLAILQSPDFTLAISADVYRAYVRALSALQFAQDNKFFESYPLTVLNALPSSSILTYDKKHLAFLTGLESDLNQIEVIDMVDGSDTIRVKMVFTAVAGYVRESEISLYKVV